MVDNLALAYKTALSEVSIRHELEVFFMFMGGLNSQGPCLPDKQKGRI